MSAGVEQVERYLLKGERIVVAVHRHWAVIAEPLITTPLALAAVTWFTVGADPRWDAAAEIAWIAWFLLFGRAMWMLHEWRREWFIATDRRLLLIYGFIVRKVDMMPLGKVTDMTYDRSIAGRLLGYGTFILESAGQDQALSKVGFIPHPDATYRAMIGQIFHREGDEDVDEGAQYDDYAAEVEAEPDPARRASLAQRFMRFTGLAPDDRHGAGLDGDDDDEGPSAQSRRLTELEHRALEKRRAQKAAKGQKTPSRRLRETGRDGRGYDDASTTPLPVTEEPPGRGLFAPRGESLYRGGSGHDLSSVGGHVSDGTSDSPVTDYRDDTTGWWNRP